MFATFFLSSYLDLYMSCTYTNSYINLHASQLETIALLIISSFASSQPIALKSPTRKRLPSKVDVLKYRG